MQKHNRIDRIDNNLTPETLQNRLPEVTCIDDESIRIETGRIFMKFCPDYFWNIPSSGSGKYHPPDERGTHGNWLHTKRVFLAYEQLARSYVEQGLLTTTEYHAGQSAALLHDMLKFGYPSAQNDHTVAEHGVIVADLIEDRSSLPQSVADAVRSHNGAWGEGTIPETPLEQVVHLADMTVTPVHYYSDVFRPTADLQEETGVGAIDESFLVDDDSDE